MEPYRSKRWKLADAKPLPDDPVEVEWDYDQFQSFCEKTYGKRRPKPDWMKPAPTKE